MSTDGSAGCAGTVAFGPRRVWLFFAEAVAAALARKVGCYILTETMERRPDVGFESYDRLFPNQDTLPRGGFGNLIALPLQKRAREQGNTTFIDDEARAHPDQWAFLSQVGRIPTEQLEDLARTAEQGGRVVGVRLPVLDEDGDEPWTLHPSRRRKDPLIAADLPTHLDLVFANEIYCEKAALPPALRDRLVRIAAFQNPEFYQAQAMRLPTYGKPRIISCAEDHGNHIGLPRGCLDQVLQLLGDLRIRATVHDERNSGRPLPVFFRGQLRPEQQAAADALMAHDTGILAATTAFGNRFVEIKRPDEPVSNTQFREIAFLRRLTLKAGIVRTSRDRPTALVLASAPQDGLRRGSLELARATGTLGCPPRLPGPPVRAAYSRRVSTGRATPDVRNHVSAGGDDTADTSTTSARAMPTAGKARAEQLPSRLLPKAGSPLLSPAASEDLKRKRPQPREVVA